MMAVFLIHPEGFQDFAGAHRQLPHAHTSGAIDGVRDRGHRRDDRYFTNTAQAERVPRIRDFHQHGIDHRQVKARRDAIVQEAGIEHRPFRIEDVLFVQSPADALHGPALNLSLDVARMDGFADVLERGVAQNLRLACLGVDLDIHDVDAESGADAAVSEVGTPDDGATSVVQPSCQLSEGQATLRIAAIAKVCRGPGEG